MGEARAVGHALPQDKVGEFAHPVGGRRRHFDDVAKLGVVADFEAGNPEALGEIHLQRRDHPAAVIAQAALGIEFAVKACRNGAVLHPQRRGIGQGRRQQVREVGGHHASLGKVEQQLRAGEDGPNPGRRRHTIAQ